MNRHQQQTTIWINLIKVTLSRRGHMRRKAYTLGDPILHKVQKQTRQTHSSEKSGECLHGNRAMEGVQEMFLGGWERSVSWSQCWFPWIYSIVASHRGAPLQFVHLSEWMFGGGGRKGEERQEKEDQLFSFHPKCSWGFLVVRWLRLCAASVGVWVQFLVS